tara:strand:+ start:147 stop:416 length:270 start_codon:yes stop_codon:yes gene_type:complete
MGFNNNDYLWILSPFDYPYDKISHVILGFIAGYYYKKLIILLILYQLLNMIYGDDKSLSSRIPSILEYTIGFLIALVILKEEEEEEEDK